MSRHTRPIEKKSYKVNTVLGKETKFKGILRFRDSLQIEGSFEGDIKSPGFLVVANGAVVVADIETGTLVVGGTVTGDVHIKEQLELLTGGKIVGNVRCSSLIMADGTSVQGRCEMLEDPTGVDIFSMPIDRLKKTIKRVE